MSRRWGILGGTFDPIHLGHLRIAEEASEALDLDSFLFIPSATPPHKPNRQITSFEHRLQMLEMALSNNSKFQFSDLEQKLSGKSYTVVTLTKLLESFAEETELYFLVGMDSFLELDTWWRYRELFSLARIVVVQRPGYAKEKMEEFLLQKVSADYQREEGAGVFTHPHLLPIHLMENTHMGISSTQIRRLVSEGRSIRYLVPDDVMSYIIKNNHYKIEGR